MVGPLCPPQRQHGICQSTKCHLGHASQGQLSARCRGGQWAPSELFPDIRHPSCITESWTDCAVAGVVLSRERSSPDPTWKRGPPRDGGLQESRLTNRQDFHSLRVKAKPSWWPTMAQSAPSPPRAHSLPQATRASQVPCLGHLNKSGVAPPQGCGPACSLSCTPSVPPFPGSLPEYHPSSRGLPRAPSPKSLSPLSLSLTQLLALHPGNGIQVSTC